MISALRLVRAIGQFVNVDAGVRLPFEKLTILYSENGRGKTTLAAVLRSLSTGDPTPIVERKRISGSTEPEVVIALSDGPTTVFRDGAWTDVHNEIVVLDDEFVDQNIYSGLGVDPEHRQHLHELIIGTQAVALHRQLADLVVRVETHNRELRVRAGALPAIIRVGLSVDEFCSLPHVPDLDSKIAQTERDLAIAQEAQAVTQAPPITPLEMSPFDSGRIADLLADTLGLREGAVPEIVRHHLQGLGTGGERWVEEGLRRLKSEGHDSSHCPFCAQELAGSALIDPYETLFSDAYRELGQRVADWIEAIERRHGGDAIAAFERSVREVVEAAAFWRPFVSGPMLSVDTAVLGELRTRAREAVREALVEKAQNPLMRLELSTGAETAIREYNEGLHVLASANEAIREMNVQIAVAKERVTAANANELAGSLRRLQAIKSRYEPAMADACAAFVAERLAKEQTERQRAEKRGELDALRTAVFPGYQESTNFYLQRLNAGFRLDSISPVNTRGGPSVTYNVLIEEMPVAVQGEANLSGPSFRTALSAGDRTTLALAFFFALLEHTQALDTRIVVVDDPVSSLDDQRSWATVQELRRLAERVQQVIVMSHNKQFLCNLWEASERSARSSLQITRAPQGSALDAWDVDRDSLGEHDRRDLRFRGFLDQATGDRLELARDLRPHLEAYLRYSHPAEFPPGSLLGPFLQTSRDRLGTPREVIDRVRISELQELVDFANRFHHDTNPRASTEQVTDAELRGMVVRVRRFVGA